MNAITLRLPEALQERLKRSAQVNHRSVNKQAIAILEQALASEPASLPDAARTDLIHQQAAELMEMGRRFGALPVLDTRTPDEILGYDELGLPA